MFTHLNRLMILCLIVVLGGCASGPSQTSGSDVRVLGFELGKTVSYAKPKSWTSFGKPPVERDGEVVMRMKKLVNDNNGDFILITFISPTEDAPIVVGSDQLAALESLHRKGIEIELPNSLEGEYSAFRIDSGKNIGFMSVYTDKNAEAALKKGEKTTLARAAFYLNPKLNRGVLAMVSFYTNNKDAVADDDFLYFLYSMQLN